MEELLEKIVPLAESFKSRIKKYDSVYKQIKSEIAQLEKERDANKESVKRWLELADKLNEMEDLRQTVEHVPPQILDLYAKKSHAGKNLIGEEL